MPNNNPGFLQDFGLADDPTSEKAFNLLNDIIGRRGRTGRSRTPTSNLALRARLRAQDADVEGRRRVQDLSLLAPMITKPALEKRNLDLQKLRNTVTRKGGQAQSRAQLFQGLGSLVSMAADIQSAFANRAAETE